MVLSYSPDRALVCGQVLGLSAFTVPLLPEPLHRPTLDPTPSPYTSPTPEIDALHPALHSLVEEVRLLRAEIQELQQSLRLIEHKPEPKPALPHNTKPGEAPTWANLLDALDN